MLGIAWRVREGLLLSQVKLVSYCMVQCIVWDSMVMDTVVPVYSISSFAFIHNSQDWTSTRGEVLTGCMH